MPVSQKSGSEPYPGSGHLPRTPLIPQETPCSAGRQAIAYSTIPRLPVRVVVCSVWIRGGRGPRPRCAKEWPYIRSLCLLLVLAGTLYSVHYPVAHAWSVSTTSCSTRMADMPDGQDGVRNTLPRDRYRGSGPYCSARAHAHSISWDDDT